MSSNVHVLSALVVRRLTRLHPWVAGRGQALERSFRQAQALLPLVHEALAANDHARADLILAALMGITEWMEERLRESTDFDGGFRVGGGGGAHGA